MTSSATSHIQAAAITEDYPALFDESYRTSEKYGQSSLVDAIFYPYLASDHPISSQQEEAYDGNQLSYANWLRNYDSGFSSCWAENLFCYNSSTDGNDYGVQIEDSLQNAEHYDTDFHYQEDNDNQPAFDYNTCYESCYGFIEEIFNYSEQEPRPAYGSSKEEMGFCGGIFGYWPCLLREMQYNYQQ